MSKLQEIIEEIVKSGVEVTIGYNRQKERAYYDLNTQMKSHLHIYEDNSDNIIVEGRYDYIAHVDDLSDVMYQIKYCNHGRGFYNPQYQNLFDRFGIKIESHY